MSQTRTPDIYQKIKRLMAVLVAGLMVLVAVALIVMWARPHWDKTDVVGEDERDQYTKMAGEMLEQMNAGEIGASLQTKLSYIWAQDAYYQMTGAPKSLQELKKFLNSAAKDAKKKQSQAFLYCLLMNDVASDVNLGESERSKAQEICQNVNYDYYVDPELAKLREMMIKGQNDNTDAHSVFFYPEELINQESEKLGQQLERFAQSSEFSWPVSESVTGEIITNNIKNQLYTLFDKYYYSKMMMRSNDEQLKKKGQLARLEYLWMTGEVLEWYTQANKYASEAVDMSIVHDSEVVCLLGQAIGFFADEGGYFTNEMSGLLQSRLVAYGPATCDVVSYAHGDPVTKKVDKELVIEKLNNTAGLLENGDYGNILAAGLLARKTVTSERLGNPGVQVSLQEYLQAPTLEETIEKPDLGGISAAEIEYYNNLVFSQEELDRSEAIAKEAVKQQLGSE